MNRAKFRNMVLYIVTEIHGIGAIKLQKALLFADRIHFAKMARSISGAQYVRQKFGPVIEKVGFHALQDMIWSGVIFQSQDDKTQRHYTDEAPDLSAFDGEEIASLNSAVSFVRRKSAETLSELTHDDLWKSTPDGQILPYEKAVTWKITDVNKSSPERSRRVMALIADVVELAQAESPRQTSRLALAANS